MNASLACLTLHTMGVIDSLIIHITISFFNYSKAWPISSPPHPPEQSSANHLLLHSLSELDPYSIRDFGRMTSSKLGRSSPAA